MASKVNLSKHQATGWDHFRAKRLSEKQKLMKDNEIENSQNKKNNFFSWIMKTLNPINHIPVISTIKNLNAKAEHSLDIVQSAIGGIIYGGPYGLLKGIGGWIATKLIGSDKKFSELKKNNNNVIKNSNDILSQNIEKITKRPTHSNIFNVLEQQSGYVKNTEPNYRFKDKNIFNDYNLILAKNSRKMLELYSSKEAVKIKKIRINA